MENVRENAFFVCVWWGFSTVSMKNMQSKPHASTLLLHLPRLYLGLWISCFSMAVAVEEKQMRDKQSLRALTRICTKLKMLKKVCQRASITRWTSKFWKNRDNTPPWIQLSAPLSSWQNTGHGNNIQSN